MSINFDKLVVSGIDYITVRKLEIKQQVNAHASAEIELEVDAQTGKVYMDEVNERELITIGVPEIIFAGVVEKIKLVYEDTYCVLKINLLSTSVLWDIQKINRSYQRVGTSYSEIMKKAVEGMGTVEFHGNDITSEGLMVQYQETSWEFILRLAAECKEPVYVNAASQRPHVIIGTVPGEESYSGNVTSTDGGAGSTRGYVTLGAASIGGNIGSTISTMRNGELITSYESMTADAMIPKKSSVSFAGRVMNAEVEGIQRDMVQVHIKDLDSEYDEQGDVWLPYSTLYSSEEFCSGIYCMPAEKDPVRVFFPTDNPADAFVSSSYNVRGKQRDYKEKCFMTPNGMMILFGKDGLLIRGEKKETYIELKKSGDIEIQSEQNIDIHARKNITMTANEGILHIKSDKNITLVTGKSVLDIQDKEAVMFSDRIMVK